MKQAIGSVLAVGALVPLLLAGCATKGTVAEGSEVFVVNAEQTQQMAFEAVNAFLQFEQANRDALWAVDHGIKQAADELRRTFPAANESAVNALGAYKHNRTVEGRADVNTALAVLETLKREAQAWMAVAGSR